MPGNITYFISDMHLGAHSTKNPRENEQRLVDWLDSIKHDANALYMLGDVLDYWYEYKYVVPKGFVRFFGKLAELADSGVKIYWFTGNHDIWLFDYFQKEIGITIIDGALETTIGNKRFYLAHGDANSEKSRSFKFIRSLFRNRFCQWLYSAIHPRWTIPFALSWSHHSRKTGNAEPEPAAEARINKALDNLESFAISYNQQHADAPIDYFVFGHLHILLDKPLPTHGRLLVIGDWLNIFSYGRFDGNTLKINTI